MLTRCAADDGGFAPWAGALVQRPFNWNARRHEALILVATKLKALFQ